MDGHDDRSGKSGWDSMGRADQPCTRRFLGRAIRPFWSNCLAATESSSGRDFASSQLAGYVRRPGYPPVPVIRLNIEQSSTCSPTSNDAPTNAAAAVPGRAAELLEGWLAVERFAAAARLWWWQRGPVRYLVGSPGGIAPPGSHGTERDSLPSLRSSHRIRQKALVHAQCLNRPGSRATRAVHQALKRLKLRNRLYFF